MTLFGFLALVLGLGIAGVIAGAIFSPKFRRNLNIWGDKVNDGMNSDIDHEVKLIEKQEAIVADGRRKASDLRGTLNNERTKLAAANTAVTEATNDLKLAIEMAKGRGLTTNEQLEADPIVSEQAAKVEAANTERDILAGSVASIEGTVKTTKDAVEAAQAELRRLQLTVKSHAAKAKATDAVNGAANVIDSFKGMNSTGSEIAKYGDRINEKHEQAKARLEDAQGSEAQREFEKAKRQRGLGGIIAANSGNATEQK